MGIYIYGVSSRSRKVKGLDKPVYGLTYITKEFWGFEKHPRIAPRLASYQSKNPMTGAYVAYELGEEEFIQVMVYKGKSNVFSDYRASKFEQVGYARLVGRQYQMITDLEYALAMGAKERAKKGVDVWANARSSK